jgi:membrane fusion protein, multidrug efflux system
MTFLCLTVLVVAALSLVACGKPAAQLPAVPPSVEYLTVEDRLVTLTNQLPGRTSAYETSDGRPQVNGLIETRLFTEGDLVRKGQPLYRIDASLTRRRSGEGRNCFDRSACSRLWRIGQDKRDFEAELRERPDKRGSGRG